MNVGRLADRAGELHPGRLSALAVFLLRWIAAPLARFLLRARVSGWENIPREGAYLLVANHPPGLGAAELLSFGALWLARFGEPGPGGHGVVIRRPLTGFAHPFAFHVWPIAPVMRGLGSVPSSYEAGERALASGSALFILPGGDLEATRAFWDRRVRGRADFGGRVGFLRLARRANVPIVPLAFRGARVTTPILWQSTAVLSWLLVLPRLFGVKRWPVTLLGVVTTAAIVFGLPALGPWRFLLAWFCLGSPQTVLPIVPWPVRVRIGPALSAAEVFADGDDEPGLRAALARVEGAVTELLR